MTEPALDTDRVAAELLRALRGARSQVQWSRRLGYRSNVAYAWESGRRWPTAAETLRAVRRSGLDLDAALRAFLGQRPPWVDEVDVATAEGVARLLDDLRGALPITDLARRAGVSRSAMSRWLSGSTQPRLPEFLGAVEAASVRLVDFVTALVPADQVPSVRPLWERLEARRRGAFEAPWTQAVVRALELVDYRALPAHEPGWVARRLGIAPEEEAVCLGHLERSGQIRWDGARWQVEALAVDTRTSPEIGPHLKAHWTGVARERIDAGAPGQFSYNVFTVSQRDLARIRELHLAYYQELRAIVADSEPAERVVVANVQLFALDGPLPDPQR
jgi:transcriptional regulator with XRE-family HTH domain